MGRLHFVDYRKKEGCGKQISKLYREAFPAVERLPLWALRRLARGRRARLYGIYDADRFIGMLYAVYDQDIVFVFYLAIDGTLRGGGYGSRVLRTVQKKYADCRIILNIEEADPDSGNYAQRVRRREFYQKNGFESLHYTIKEAGVAYEMLCHSRNHRGVSREEYMELMRKYFGDRLFRVFYQKISK